MCFQFLSGIPARLNSSAWAEELNVCYRYLLLNLTLQLLQAFFTFRIPDHRRLRSSSPPNEVRLGTSALSLHGRRKWGSRDAKKSRNQRLGARRRQILPRKTCQYRIPRLNTFYKPPPVRLVTNAHDHSDTNLHLRIRRDYVLNLNQSGTKLVGPTSINRK